MSRFLAITFFRLVQQRAATFQSDVITYAAAKLPFATVLAVTTVGLSGCYNHQFQKSEPAAVKGIKSKVQIGVIEFDDMGELFNRCDLSPQDDQPCQLIEVQKWIELQRKAAAPVPTVVVTFVHGWDNNAAPSNDDLRQFSTELDRLQYGSEASLHVIGVYIGWRGSSTPGRHTIEYFWTVFNREAAAHRVASVSATEVLFRIRDSAKKTLPGVGRGGFVLVGHSFGGLIVERTLAQALTAFMVLSADRNPDDRTCEGGGVQPFADLTVLINPAIDAIETQQLIDMMKRARVKTCSPNKGFQPPLLGSIKSQTDNATGFAFVFGHTLESENKVFRHYGDAPALSSETDPKPPSQWSVYKHTAGSLSYYQNYCFIEDGNAGDNACKDVAKEVNEERNKLGNPKEASLAFPKNTPNYQQAFANSAYPNPVAQNLYTRFRGKCTYDKCDVWNNTPYWIFTVPNDVVAGHSGWASSKLALLLEDIVRETLLAEKSKTIGFD
ncbi:MAG TPA: hypothetical protein VF753_08760 [Terriglobales bacterium]